MSSDQLRLLARVARMYHEQGMRQPEIAAQLHLSQSRISRLLKQAVDLGIVRTVVVLPPGIYSDMEDRLKERFGLRDAVIVDTGGATDPIPALGGATADYLQSTLTGTDVIGISSWSETLLAAVDALPRLPGAARAVVQLLGGVGDPNVQLLATRLAGRLAEQTGAEPYLIPAPGLVGSLRVRRALEHDDTVTKVMALWADITVALIGVGSLSPSPLLRHSGNAMTEDEQSDLRDRGAVGDVCLRFFDAAGVPVRSPVDDRVLGITPRALKAIDRRIAVAGGHRKASGIAAALRGGWANILITDIDVARCLTS